jgi:hypothetical protein
MGEQVQDWTNLSLVIGSGIVTNVVDAVQGERRFYRLIRAGNIAQGLSAYYPFNGNANDESGHLQDGTASGASLVSDRFGNTARAYSFDGASSYVEIPPASFDSGDYSVSLWFNAAQYPDSAGAGREAAMLFSRGRNNAELHLGIGNPHNVKSGIRFLPRIVDGGTGVSFDAPAANYSTNKWVHLVATYQGATRSAHLYLDGEERIRTPETIVFLREPNFQEVTV